MHFNHAYIYVHACARYCIVFCYILYCMHLFAFYTKQKHVFTSFFVESREMNFSLEVSFFEGQHCFLESCGLMLIRCRIGFLSFLKSLISCWVRNRVLVKRGVVGKEISLFFWWNFFMKAWALPRDHYFFHFDCLFAHHVPLKYKLALGIAILFWLSFL